VKETRKNDRSQVNHSYKDRLLVLFRLPFGPCIAECQLQQQSVEEYKEPFSTGVIMASLSYMIYKAHQRGEPKQSSHESHVTECARTDATPQQIFASFRRKSMLVAAANEKNPDELNRPLAHKWGSIGTLAPATPKLRDLVKESGIFDDWMSQDPPDDFSDVWDRADNPNVDISIFQTALRQALDDVLSMDDEEPLTCICPDEPCVYHPKSGGLLTEPANVPHFPQKSSQVSQSSMDTPTPGAPDIDFAKFSPPRPNPSVKSRDIIPIGNGILPNTRVRAQQLPFGHLTLLEEHDEDDIDRALTPASISHLHSAASHPTGESEITIPAQSMNSLRIDPREEGEIALRMEDWPTFQAPLPPSTRHVTPAGESSSPSSKKDAPHKDAGSAAVDEQNDSRSVGDGHLAGGVDDASRDMTVFPSPETNFQRELKVPPAPTLEFNPLLFPANLASAKAVEPAQSIADPFTSPNDQEMTPPGAAKTPRKDSNPLLFPEGLVYYPSKSSKPYKAYKKKSRHASSKNIVNATSLLDQKTKDTTCQDGSDSDMSGSTPERSVSIRVKMAPREITYIIDQQEYVQQGYYSGPINRHGKMHGNGIFWFTSGDLYLGQFSDGCLHGVGAMSVMLGEGDVKQVFRGTFHKNEFISHQSMD